MFYWEEPRFPPNTEQKCGQCGQTKVMSDSKGLLPGDWETSWLYYSDGKGNLRRDRPTATCPRCIWENERERLADEWDYAHENPYR